MCIRDRSLSHVGTEGSCQRGRFAPPCRAVALELQHVETALATVDEGLVGALILQARTDDRRGEVDSARRHDDDVASTAWSISIDQAAVSYTHLRAHETP